MRTAAYARYSTDMQREASLEDQLRNIRQRCEREGWPAPIVYSDAAFSGARSDRPGFRTLLADATARKFCVLLVDDLSRLSRDKDDTGKAIKRMTFAGVRVIGVSDGTDTSRDGYELDTGIRAVIGEHYLRDLAKKTHRGLTGRALSGASAGGLPFGYRVAEVGQRAIDERQSAIVRRIFADYIAGLTPRAIAASLNREGTPSARGEMWCMSAIYGDLRRGIGVLANPIYAGRQIWNRSRWVKHPDSGRRLRQERPEAEWIITEHPELAIVDGATWDAAQARHRRRAITRGAPAGRAPAHLLSGILRCCECGGPMTAIDSYRYGCGRRKERGEAACGNGLKIARAAADVAILAGIRSTLLTADAWRLAERAIAAAFKRNAPDLDALKAKIAAAECVRSNIIAALRAGIITPSTKAELLEAEHSLDTARAEHQAAQLHQPAQLLPRARAAWERIAGDLETIREIPRAREAIRQLVGDRIVLRKEADSVVAVIGEASEISLVAGARSVLYLTEPFRIAIPRRPSRE
jgi:DNA invertase Pin-like site-specific DNA recombinase